MFEPSSFRCHSRDTSIVNKVKVVAILAVLWLNVVLCLGSPSSGPRRAQERPDDDVTLQSHLVNIDVMVKDGKGNFITNLTADDFTVVENGVNQKIEFFDPPVVSAGTRRTETAAQPTTSSSSVKPAVPAGEPRNIISLVLDSQTTELSNMAALRNGTLEYVRDRITNTDLVTVFRISNGLQLLQPFTQDKAKLLSAVEIGFAANAGSTTAESRAIEAQAAKQLEELRTTAGQTLPQNPTGPPDVSGMRRAAAALRALEQFSKLRSQLSLQQSRPVLAALAAICEAQRAIPGKKIVVLFSQGFVTSSIQDWQVQSTIDMANRANVAIYVVDSAGLREGPAMGGEVVPAAPLDSVSGLNSAESRIRAVGGENVFDRVRHAGAERTQDILYRISGDTGGAFIKNTNDIAKGIERIDQEIRARYTLGYYSTDMNFDGSFRKVKIEIRRPDTKVVSRAGYYAIGDEDVGVRFSQDETKLLASFAEKAAKPELPISVDLSAFRSRDGLYVLPLSVELPPEAVKFNQKGPERLMHLEVLGIVREAPSKILTRLGGNFEVRLSAEQYQGVVANKIYYRQDVELPTGTYDIELIVRDRLSGKVAAKAAKLVLPDTSADFASSGVVLSRLAIPAGPSAEGDVLSLKGVQIRSSPSREFRASDNLIIFFDVYNAALRPEVGKPQVRVTVTLMKDGKQAMRPIDYLLNETIAEPVPHLTFSKFVSLAGLPAGRYTAMIEARDVPGQKLVSRQEPFVIVQ
jgi:VWFA-related protein